MPKGARIEKCVDILAAVFKSDLPYTQQSPHIPIARVLAHAHYAVENQLTRSRTSNSSNQIYG